MKQFFDKATGSFGLATVLTIAAGFALEASGMGFGGLTARLAMSGAAAFALAVVNNKSGSGVSGGILGAGVGAAAVQTMLGPWGGFGIV